MGVLNLVTVLDTKRPISIETSDLVQYCLFFAEALAPPTNVQLRRTLPTAMEVTWDPPSYQGIAGYRVYYSMIVLIDMERWQSVEIGPFNIIEITSLEPHTVYAVRVRAKLIDGKYGNLSDIVYSNKLEDGEIYFIYLFINFVDEQVITTMET